MSTDRRAAFRDLIGRLDPAGKPALALEQGLYVEPAGSVSERIATRLELEPTSTHMLVGGIGSGKTTQLLRVQQRLADLGDVHAEYVDVPARQRIERLKPGVLLALAGLELEKHFQSSTDSQEIAEALAEIKHVASGVYDPYSDFEQGVDDSGWVPGIIEPPEVEHHLERLIAAIRTLSSELPYRTVFLFDGLDRLTDISTFAALVSQDLPMFKQAGIGVVVVAPQHARTWQHGAMQDVFDELHLHGAAGTDSTEGLAFLSAVLTTRAAGSSLLPEVCCIELAKLSGGVIRDLLALARSACEEAYRLGADIVYREHVSAAADRFGRNLLVGINQDMLDRLTSLAQPAQSKQRAGWYRPVTFTMATEADLMLLLRRLVIEVPSTTPVHYILHPTIVPLLAGLRRRA